MTLRPLALSLAAALLCGAKAAGGAHAADMHWTGSWAASPMTPDAKDALPADELGDATLREVAHLSIGGRWVRIRLSNAFGTAPLRLASVHVARALPGGAIVGGSDRTLTVSGLASPTLPAGAEVWSDPVALDLPAGADLAVSLHYVGAPAGQTSHPGAHATSYLAPGDHVSDPVLPSPTKVEHWYQLSGVDVETPAGTEAVVALGDSITDGHASTTDGNDRWPDDLARRLHAAGVRMGVLNAGIGGGRILLDGLGPNALARLDRDVIAQTGVRTVIVLEGVNDLGNLTRQTPGVTREQHAAEVRALEAGYAQIVTAGHAKGLRVLGATVTPDGGSGFYHPDAQNEADRQAVNAWIRAPGHFDGVIDFDRVVRDPSDPSRMAARYDSGDHLHPGPAGYQAMADAVPLAFLDAGARR